MKKQKTALIMVDLQNDFCPGGNLAVPEGDAVIPLANQLQACFDVVIATKDWHPQDHMSFASNHAGHKIGDVIEENGLQQILWPDHCVQRTQGAEFHPQLDTTRIQKIFLKGIDKTVDSYSAFFDNAHLRTTGLADFLLKQGINEIYILGLATDYCVKFSCLDSVRMGFNTHIIADACRGVELNEGDVQEAMDEMRDAGVIIMKSTDFIK
ncbi:MAG: bifunctional nicotinamidase/pyrazinamidase [Gammaproteobacteria bacterium]